MADSELSDVGVFLKLYKENPEFNAACTKGLIISISLHGAIYTPSSSTTHRLIGFPKDRINEIISENKAIIPGIEKLERIWKSRYRKNTFFKNFRQLFYYNYDSYRNRIN